MIPGLLYKSDIKVVGGVGREHGVGQYKIVSDIFSQKTDENKLQKHVHVPYPLCIYNTSLANAQAAPLGNYNFILDKT